VSADIWQDLIAALTDAIADEHNLTLAFEPEPANVVNSAAAFSACYSVESTDCHVGARSSNAASRLSRLLMRSSPAPAPRPAYPTRVPDSLPVHKVNGRSAGMHAQSCAPGNPA
jgi:hypothetical protein